MRYVLLLLALSSGLALNVAGPTTAGGSILQTIAATVEPIDLPHSPPADVRQWYYNHGNPDKDGYRDLSGDCVQCSLGMHGVRCNNIVAALVDFDSQYGPAIRGGSSPSRVANYCRQRGINIYNVTSDNIEVTRAWAMWAATTGRGAAIGFGDNHFQFLCGYDTKRDLWLVCDNNAPRTVKEYTEAEFRREHSASGYWLVVLDCPSPPPPITAIANSPKPSWLHFGR
jgi:hypothetical protein